MHGNEQFFAARGCKK